MQTVRIELPGLERVRQRGTGIPIEESDDSLFLYDTVSGAFFPACGDPSEGLARGFVPFCQVEKDNRISPALQKKLGMTISDGLIFWMWK